MSEKFQSHGQFQQECIIGWLKKGIGGLIKGVTYDGPLPPEGWINQLPEKDHEIFTIPLHGHPSVVD